MISHVSRDVCASGKSWSQFAQSNILGSSVDVLRPFYRVDIWRRALLLYDWLHELQNILIHTFLVAANFEKSARCMRASDPHPTDPPLSQNVNKQGQFASSKQGVGAKFATSIRVVDKIRRRFTISLRGNAVSDP